MMIRKVLCLVLALALCGAMAFAEEDGDLQAQLDAANERIAELEAQVELYQPYYDAQVIVEYDGGVVFLDDILEQYAGVDSQFSSYYGVSLADYGYDTVYKQLIAETLLQDAVLEAKATELGLDQLDDETMAGLTEEAAANFESYVTSVWDYFASDDLTDEEIREECITNLEAMGYTEDALLETLIDNYVSEQLYNYITADVTVTEEDIQAAFDELVAEQEASFADDSTYNTSRNNGDTIVWNPEGYRMVRHVLIKFTDDQATRYSELQDTLDTLNEELEALQTAAEEAAAATDESTTEATDETAAEATAEATDEAAAETTGETAEATAEATDEAAAETTGETAEATAEAADETAPEATAEATDETTGETAEATEAPARTEEEINAEIADVEAELTALYEELLPTAQEVIDAFNSGTSFSDLIDQYNEDPGMENEPTATNGYAVSANSTAWDPAFTEGAMSIESIGEISEPVYGQNGIHIIYYDSDIPAGAVDLETVRAEIEESALNTKLNDTYDNTLAEWVEAVNPVYHYDRL